MDGTTLLTVIFSAGGAAVLAAIGKGVQGWLHGVRARERDGIRDLATWRDEANDAREKAELERDWWRQRAGDLLYALAANGIDIPPERPRPQ